MGLRIKICGITKADQAIAIANLGATALGFICVPDTPRFVDAQKIGAIVNQLPNEVDRVGVFLNAEIDQILSTVAIANLSTVQLHGNESPQFCDQLRSVLPTIEIIKVFRIRSVDNLMQTRLYERCVDAFLLDAYHPEQAGGTGHTIDWTSLQTFRPGRSWFLAGGLKPSNILDALSLVQPDGIDLSSGVENAPGDKNLGQVAQLFEKLKR